MSLTYTKKRVIDSWAWIEYFRGTSAGTIVQMKMKNKELFTNAVSLSEVISKFKRERLDTNFAFEAILSLSKIIDITPKLAKEVGILHGTLKSSKPNLSLADAYALQSAIQLNAKVLTGDPDFKGIPNVEFIKANKNEI